MFASDIIGDLLCVFEVDGVAAHTDGKGTYRSFAFPCGNGTDKRGIQPAGKEEADFGIGDKPLFHTGNQLFTYVFADDFRIVMTYCGRM